MERKQFNPYKVNVRGLSRKEAKLKRRIAYREFMLFRDLEETYVSECGHEKCRRKVHTSRTYVRENMENI